MSASLDHIIPLARQGDHTRINVQLAHLLCNLRKSDKLLDAAA
ncbi:HNH endonuclease [Streptomyces sp. NPDC051907]